MKRARKSLLRLIVLIIFLFSGFSFIVDYNRVKKNEEPMFMVAKETEDGYKLTYYGLGYKLSDYPGVEEAGLADEIDINFSFWFF